MRNKSFNPVFHLAQLILVLFLILGIGAGSVMANNEDTPVKISSPLTYDAQDTVTSVVRNQLLIPSAYPYSEAKVGVIYNATNEPEQLTVYLVRSDVYAFETVNITVRENYESLNGEVAVRILPNDQQQYSLEEGKIVEVVRRELLLPAENSYSQAKVRVEYGATYGPEDLIVYLPRTDMFTYETARIELGSDYSVTSVEQNYDEQQLVPTEYDTYSCPDPSVEMVFATPCTEFPTAVAGVNRAYEIATQAGYNCKKLVGSEATSQAYRNWLSCDLKAFGNIGHGSPYGILLDDGPLYHTWFQSLSDTELSCDVIYFNSCQVHNSPLEPSIMSAGTRTFIGGDTNLYVGPSEEVFKHFWENVLLQSQGMNVTLYEWQETISNSPDWWWTGNHGFSGDGGIFKSTVISGRVTDESGSGMSGVVLSGLPENPSTDTDGYYSVTVNCGWSGAVTAQKSGYVFSPSSRIYNNIAADQTAQDYTGTPQNRSLTVIKAGAGSVTSDLAGIACGADCSEAYDANTVVTLTAEPENVCSAFDSWTGCDSVAGDECTVTMNAAKTVTATFTQKTSTITATAGSGGTISPSGTVTVSCGSSQIYTITPNTCYRIADIIVDGLSVGGVSSTNHTFTFTNVIYDREIHVIFDNAYTIEAVAGAGGTILPSGNVSVECGDEPIFTIRANECYQIENIMIDGSPATECTINAQRTVGTCVFSSVTENHSIEASFFQLAYNINVSHHTVDGRIQDGGDFLTMCGDNLTVEMLGLGGCPSSPSGTNLFMPSIIEGYHIQEILIDGESVELIPCYTFANVTSNHSMEVIFVPDAHTITAIAGPGGSISPDGDMSVSHEADQTFTITPDTGYTVQEVLIDGVSVGAVTSYTFTNVTENHSIEVSFTSTCACNEPPTIQSVGSGSWNDPETWTPEKVPGMNDVVLIREGHTITGSPYFVTIKELCNYGTLISSGVSDLWLRATEFIQNQGNILGQNGADGSGSTVLSYVHAKPGRNIFLHSRNIYNGEHAKIKAGQGGHDITHGPGRLQSQNIVATGANGGAIDVLADDTLINCGIIGSERPHVYNNGTVSSDSGNGGIGSNSYHVRQCPNGGTDSKLTLSSGYNYKVYNSSQNRYDAAYGGNGGNVTVIGNIELTNESTGRISSGYGGDARAWGCSSYYYMEKGKGGTLSVGSVGIFNQRGTLSGGGDGRVLGEPEIMMSGSSMRITDAREVVLFGGDSWLLDLRNLSPNAIEATERIILAVGTGGTIDLRGNTTQVMTAGIEVQIFADEVLLDEGVTLEDLIDSSIERHPSKILYEATLSVTGENMGQAGSTISLDIGIVNAGPADDTYTLSVTDSAGWNLSGLSSSISVGSLSKENAYLDVTLPDSPGASNVITVTATSASDPDTVAEATIRVSVEPSSGPDSDGDTVADDQDAFPNDPNEWMDSDDDGTGDNTDTDTDNDGMPNEWEIEYDIFLNPFVDDASEDADNDGWTNKAEFDNGTNPADAADPGYFTPDSDGDGVSDDQDVFPDDPTESQDSDGDGIGDNEDPDDNNDGIPDELSSFEAGVFIVGDTGIVKADWLYDGGVYEGEFGIFSLSGMENFIPNSPEFIAEAVRRVLSNSELGYLIFSDSTQGARFSGQLGSSTEPDRNKGNYLGLKECRMNAGDTFAAILVPNSTFDVLSGKTGTTDANIRPIFSLASSNPDHHMYFGQIAKIKNGDEEFRNAVVFEDMLLSANSDRDYNDIIVHFSGVTVSAPTLDNPELDMAEDWRREGLGSDMVDHIEVSPPDPDTLWITITLKSPADLLVYDPEGRVIGKEGGYIPGATFEFDENGHQIVSLPALAEGEYRVVLRAIGDGGLCHLEIKGYQGDTELMVKEEPFTIGPHEVFTTTVSASLFMNGGEISFEIPELTLACDFDGDGSCHDNDIENISSLWNTCIGDQDYDAFFDSDNDGCITVLDIMPVVNGKTAP
jgi:hypothetical protein